MSSRYVHYHWRRMCNFFIKRQVCPEFINAIMENNQSNNSGGDSKLYNTLTKGFPLLSHTFIWTSPVCFAVTKLPYATLIYLYVSTNEPSIKYEISGVMWKVAPKSKIQLVGFKLYPKSLIGIYALEHIRAKDAYIFCDSLWYVLFSEVFLFLSVFMHKF